MPFEKGRTKSGGRQKGTPNKRTIALNKVQALAPAKTADGIEPLDVMLANMRWAHSRAAELLVKLLDPQTPENERTKDAVKELLALRELAGKWAKDAAPYRHAALQSTQMQQLGADGRPIGPRLVEVEKRVEVVRVAASGVMAEAAPGPAESRH